MKIRLYYDENQDIHDETFNTKKLLDFMKNEDQELYEYFQQFDYPEADKVLM